jgi:hypothetical protein
VLNDWACRFVIFIRPLVERGSSYEGLRQRTVTNVTQGRNDGDGVDGAIGLLFVKGGDRLDE